MGALVATHLVLTRTPLGQHAPAPYDGYLLRAAEDLAQRLLPAFDTPTGAHAPVCFSTMWWGMQTCDVLVLACLLHAYG